MSDNMMNDEETPDSLMDNFKGKGIVAIVVFTVVVHLVLITVTSVPFLMKNVFGEDTSKLSEEERIKAAVEDATEALREIAEEHGLNPQDISSQFGGGGSRSVQAAATQPDAAPETTEKDEKEPERVKSEYEKKLEVKAEGPKVPSFTTDKEDIF